MLYDELPDGVLVVDPGGRIEVANRAFLSLVGRSSEQVVGCALEDIVADEDVVRLLGFESIFSDALIHDTSVIFATPEGEQRTLLVSSSRAGAGERTFLVARAPGQVRKELEDASRWVVLEQERADALTKARDAIEAKHAALCAAQAELESAYERLKLEVAARERLENELRLAQKLEAIGQLSAGLAHEINTPLQYIGDNNGFLVSVVQQLADFTADVRAAGEAGTLEVLRRKLAEAAEKADLAFVLEEAPRALAASQAGVERVSVIVRAMKSFARAEQHEKLPGDINQSLSDTLVVAHSQYKDVAEVDVELGSLPSVTCFVSAMNQVFLNLIVNAAHAIQATQRGELGKIRVSSRAVDGVVEVEVSDDGTGIPEAIRHRIFDPFFTTKPVGSGSGQGLATARSVVVDTHGGTITFTSEVGKGTTFRVRLPIDGTTRLG